MSDRRTAILLTVSDLVSDFFYYDRKEDEQLGRGDIEEAIEAGEITADEIVDEFRRGIMSRGLGGPAKEGSGEG